MRNKRRQMQKKVKNPPFKEQILDLKAALRKANSKNGTLNRHLRMHKSRSERLREENKRLRDITPTVDHLNIEEWRTKALRYKAELERLSGLARIFDFRLANNYMDELISSKVKGDINGTD